MPYCSFDSKPIGRTNDKGDVELVIPKSQVAYWLSQYPHAGDIDVEGSHANIEYQALQLVAKLHPTWTMKSTNEDDPQKRTVLEGMHDMMVAFAESHEAVTGIS